MATRIVTTISCDKCGRASESVSTFTIPVGALSYAVDLCAKDARPFVTAISIAQEYGHRLTAGGSRYRTTTVDSDPRAIRAWAASNGVEVPAKGRLPKSVVEQYRAAH